MSEYGKSQPKRKSGQQARPGRASDYIEHWEDLVQRGAATSVVLYARSSHRTQDRRGNLSQQLAGLREQMKRYGVLIVAEFKETGSGWEIDRERLKAAARRARKTGTVVVAESTDRFIRSKNYHSKKNPSARPTVAEFEALKQATRGIVLATIQPPDADWKKVRGCQSKRGQSAKGQRGGRPGKPGHKKRRRLKQVPRVLRLRQKGLTYRAVAERTGISTMVVWDWVNKYE